MVVTKTSTLPTSAGIQKTTQLPPDPPTPTIQYKSTESVGPHKPNPNTYKAGTIGPLEPAGRKIARVVLPKTTRSVREVGYTETAKRVAVGTGRSVISGISAGSSMLRSGAPAFVSSPPPALKSRSSNIPNWVLGGGYPWQRKPPEPRNKRSSKKKSTSDDMPNWIRY